MSTVKSVAVEASMGPDAATECSTTTRMPVVLAFDGGGPSSYYRGGNGVGDGRLGVGASLLERGGSPGARLYSRIRNLGHDLASSARDRATTAPSDMLGDSVGRKRIELSAMAHHTVTHTEHTCQRSDQLASLVDAFAIE